jgi:hypothetical protein
VLSVFQHKSLDRVIDTSFNKRAKRDRKKVGIYGGHKNAGFDLTER